MTGVWLIRICEECGHFDVWSQEEARERRKDERQWFLICREGAVTASGEFSGHICHGRLRIFRSFKTDLREQLTRALEDMKDA